MPPDEELPELEAPASGVVEPVELPELAPASGVVDPVELPELEAAEGDGEPA